MCKRPYTDVGCKHLFFPETGTKLNDDDMKAVTVMNNIELKLIK